MWTLTTTDEINMSESFSIEYTPLLMSTELISSNKCFHAFECPDQLFCPVLWVSGPPCSCEGDHHGYFFVSPLIVVSSCPWSSCLSTVLFLYASAFSIFCPPRSNEACNAGKEIEVMKRLTLHRIASWRHCFIAPSAQLCLQGCQNPHPTSTVPIAGHRSIKI
jgi:hypothetical protein